MKFNVNDEHKSRNIPFALRQMGYRQEVKRSGAVSYVRSVSGGEFPRFHIYIEELPDGWRLNLHLDQKAPSYRGTRAHGGEYEGELVERETARLRAAFGTR